MIANTDNQYLVPTSGKPLRGLIQDHVVAGVWMTCQDTFFTREQYFQLLYGALRPEESLEGGRLITLPPTIWKPKPLWTGKQIVPTRYFSQGISAQPLSTDLDCSQKYNPKQRSWLERRVKIQSAGSSLGEGLKRRSGHLHGW